MVVVSRQISARENMPSSVYIARRSVQRTARSIKSNNPTAIRKSANERGSIRKISRQRFGSLGAVGDACGCVWGGNTFATCVRLGAFRFRTGADLKRGQAFRTRKRPKTRRRDGVSQKGLILLKNIEMESEKPVPPIRREPSQRGWITKLFY